MRNSREFMMRVLVEMLVKIKQKIRCGIGAEEGNFSVSSSYVLDRKIFTNIDWSNEKVNSN